MKARAKKDNSQLNVKFNIFYNILKFEISQKINVSFTEVYQVNFSQTQTCLKKNFSFFCAYHDRFSFLNSFEKLYPRFLIKF